MSNRDREHMDDLKTRAWENMEEILDREMPYRRGVFYYRLRIAASIFLCLMTGIYGMYQWSGDSGGHYDIDLFTGTMEERTASGPEEKRHLEELDYGKRDYQPGRTVERNNYNGNKSGIPVLPQPGSVHIDDTGYQNAARDLQKEITVVFANAPEEEGGAKEEPVELLRRNKIPFTYSPLSTGKANVSMVNKHYDSTRRWPKTSFRPSLFTGTVWIPSRSIGFFNFGLGGSWKAGDFTITLNPGMTRIITGKFNNPEGVVLTNLDPEKNILANFQDNRYENAFQAPLGASNNKYTEIRPQWGFSLPVELGWKPRDRVEYAISGGMYLLRTKFRVVYPSAKIDSDVYTRRTDHIPFIGGGMNISIHPHFKVGLESVILDPFSGDELIGVGAKFHARL